MKYHKHKVNEIIRLSKKYNVSQEEVKLIILGWEEEIYQKMIRAEDIRIPYIGRLKLKNAYINKDS